MRESEESFRQLLDGISGYAVYMLDPDGISAGWSSAAYKIKGYRAAEIIGQHFSVFHTQEDIDAGEPARLLETARTEGCSERQLWLLRRAGSRFHGHRVINAARAAGALLGTGVGCGCFTWLGATLCADLLALAAAAAYAALRPPIRGDTLFL